jgi:hypothetical protein
VLAFQVRRKEKEREWQNLKQFVRMIEEKDLDKLTFLYLRNGGKVYRLSTKVEWGEKLFPDMTSSSTRGDKLWAKMFGGYIKGIISDDEHQAIVQAEEEHAREVAAMPKKDRWMHETHWPESRDHEPFTRESVHYDDISKFIKDEADKHNRLVLVLQGLLDRSPVFHPHPPWQLWSDAGFSQALSLVYDAARALTPGDAPNFEAYQSRLNGALELGSITVGQEIAWLRREAEKESRRMDRDPRSASRDWRPSTYKPPGDPGPGTLAHVARVTSSKKHGLLCSFDWMRSKKKNAWRDDDEEEIPCSMTVPAPLLLNVSAYKPGDFKQFFDDPRTRADYLKWAPMLLTAEDYHGKKREVRPLAKITKKEPSRENQIRYQKKKARLAIVGKAVRLAYAIHTTGGTRYDKGSLWRAERLYRNKFSITGIDENGCEERDADGNCVRYVTGVEFYNLAVDSSIPDTPKGEKNGGV